MQIRLLINLNKNNIKRYKDCLSLVLMTTMFLSDQKGRFIYSSTEQQQGFRCKHLNLTK